MGSGEEEQSTGTVVDHQHHQPPQYGTFQGVANYPPTPYPLQEQHHPPPVIGFPQPAPSPGVSYPAGAPHYPHGYQTVPVYAVAEGTPVRERRLPLCGIGLGWFLFITGFFLGSIPWYVGLIVLLCTRRVDHRDKPGLIACTIAAILVTIAVMLGCNKRR